MGVTNAPIDWYTARAAGIVAYALLTVVVLVGLSLAGQVRVPHWPKFAVADVHRFGGLLVGAFVSIHVATIALDSYTPFTLTGMLVPFTSRYRPLWTALGIVAVELLIALAVTNALRKRIPYLWWRRIHILNFAVWGAATAHGIGAGTDTRSTWMIALYTASVSSVLSVLAWRATRRQLTRSAHRGLSGLAGLAGIAAVLGLAATPHTRAAHAAVVPPKAFSDQLAGAITQQDGAGGSLLSIVGTGTGQRRVLVRIDLVSTDGQSIANTALQVEDVASHLVCRGTVSNVRTTGFNGSCAFPGGSARTVSAVWRLADRHFTGSLSLTK